MKKGTFHSISGCIFAAVCLFICSLASGSQIQSTDKLITIPFGGNAWIKNPASDIHAQIGQQGLSKWTNKEDVVSLYFKTDRVGAVHLYLHPNDLSGEAKIEVRLGKTSRKVSIKSGSRSPIDAGTYEISSPGYQEVQFRGITKTGATFGNFESIAIGGQPASGKLDFVRDEYYWGRRGPSVHLSYQVPQEVGDIEYFYNEVIVPEGNDVVGSYFMANGFGEGYFGIQVNSSSERRILFSVWSPFKTDDPKSIPDDQKIVLLKKGDHVQTGEFGNEGSGGQSYRKYMWKGGTTYRFLVRVRPSENQKSDYTAYFYAPEIGKWELIASFRRPQTSTWLKRPHSFLENFNPEKGNITRKACYANQWVCSSDGKWHEMVRAKFTADATARKGARLDYSGGVDGDRFYLHNCGFFSETTKLDTIFQRSQSGKMPDIDLSKLP